MSTRWHIEDFVRPSRPVGQSSNSAGRQKHTTKHLENNLPAFPCSMPCCIQPNSVTIPQELDLIDGVSYFKIGEVVRVRRYFSQVDEYSSWLPGTVVRPVLVPCMTGGTERLYIVSYTNPYTRLVQEKLFAPYLKEISEISSELPLHQTIFSRKSKPQVVCAYIPDIRPGRRQSHAWTPALVLSGRSSRGFRVRILAGVSTNQEMDGIHYIMPYSPRRLTQLEESRS